MPPDTGGSTATSSSAASGVAMPAAGSSPFTHTRGSPRPRPTVRRSERVRRRAGRRAWWPRTRRSRCRPPRAAANRRSRTTAIAPSESDASVRVVVERVQLGFDRTQLGLERRDRLGVGPNRRRRGAGAAGADAAIAMSVMSVMSLMSSGSTGVDATAAAGRREATSQSRPRRRAGRRACQVARPRWGPRAGAGGRADRRRTPRPPGAPTCRGRRALPQDRVPHPPRRRAHAPDRALAPQRP